MNNAARHRAMKRDAANREYPADGFDIGMFICAVLIAIGIGTVAAFAYWWLG